MRKVEEIIRKKEEEQGQSRRKGRKHQY